MLEKITIEPQGEHKASVIWLHGLGADGHDFEAIVPELHVPVAYGIRFIFPHAPMRAITINNGFVMRGWYDIRSLQLDETEDVEGVEVSAGQLTELIEQELAEGIDSKKIILAGFSQGGVIALQAGLIYHKPLGGVMAFSTYVADQSNLAQRISAENRQLPVLMAHGIYDDVIPVELAKKSKNLLESLNYTVEWYDYPMAHSIHPEEVKVIAQWIERILS
jgi:phospholipase/carboxylesterase